MAKRLKNVIIIDRILDPKNDSFKRNSRNSLMQSRLNRFQSFSGSEEDKENKGKINLNFIKTQSSPLIDKENLMGKDKRITEEKIELYDESRADTLEGLLTFESKEIEQFNIKASALSKESEKENLINKSTSKEIIDQRKSLKPIFRGRQNDLINLKKNFISNGFYSSFYIL